MKLKTITITLIYLLFIDTVKTVEILRPRGVSVPKASLYDPEKDFTCFDGTLSVPFLYVNDDYCDCPDGSDEPGTAACPNGTFHCTNAGHQTSEIPSSRVNDGICDCCDATDEFNGNEKVGGGFCTNTCLEMGRAAREEAQRLAEVQKRGAELRREMAKKAATLKAEKAERLTQLKKDSEEAEALKSEKEAIKKDAEERESAALKVYREAEELEKQQKADLQKEENEKEAKTMFTAFDSNTDGRISLSELQSRQAFDQNRDGQVTEEEARFFLNQNEEVGEDAFITECWPRMKPFYMMNSGMFIPPGDQEEIIEEPEDQKDETEEPEDVEAPEPDEDTDEQDADDHSHEEEDKDDEEEKEEEKPSPEVQYDEETQQLIDVASNARHEFDEADRALRDVQRELKQIEESLEKDYGPEGEFAALEGECFEFSDREYIYKLCPFDQATQRPKNGGSDTRLGTWGHWAGPDNDKYSQMMYANGQSCWNGPQRSTNVVISCGTENQVTGVSEPNRCEYKLDFQTPAACRIADEASTRGSHDEL